MLNHRYFNDMKNIQAFTFQWFLSSNLQQMKLKCLFCFMYVGFAGVPLFNSLHCLLFPFITVRSFCRRCRRGCHHSNSFHFMESFPFQIRFYSMAFNLRNDLAIHNNHSSIDTTECFTIYTNKHTHTQAFIYSCKLLLSMISLSASNERLKLSA